jgi:hypothetical protein
LNSPLRLATRVALVLDHSRADNRPGCVSACNFGSDALLMALGFSLRQ